MPGGMGVPPPASGMMPPSPSPMMPPMAANPTSSVSVGPPTEGSNGIAPAGGSGIDGVAYRASGGFNVAKHPSLGPSWEQRQQARGMHVGPILSAVPGRTDNHHTSVPSGSYVLPAQHIASMGQGNSVAGLASASKMFGGGPYGTTPMRGGRGAGLPRAPRAAGFAAGGHPGPQDHEPVEVMLSGGEFVIPPEVVRQIGQGSLKNGHAILDAWVMATRKKEIETQRKLPPPAKK